MVIPARRHACTPTDNGSSNAPSSKLTESGNLEINNYNNYRKIKIIIIIIIIIGKFQDKHVFITHHICTFKSMYMHISEDIYIMTFQFKYTHVHIK